MSTPAPPVASGTLYASIADLRTSMSGIDGGSGTAARLSDAQLELALYAASNRVSVYAGNVYDSSTPDAIPPPILHDLTLDLAVFWASTTYLKWKALEPTSPVFLRYTSAMQVLNGVRNGTILLDPAPAPGIGEETGTVINRIPQVFTGEDSNTRRNPYTGILQADAPPGMWAPLSDGGPGSPVYQGLGALTMATANTVQRARAARLRLVLALALPYALPAFLFSVRPGVRVLRREFMGMRSLFRRMVLPGIIRRGRMAQHGVRLRVLAEIPDCRLVVSVRRLFRGAVGSQVHSFPVDLDAGHPLALQLVPADALEPGRVVALHLPVGMVLAGTGSVPQVRPAVIQPVAVGMVDFGPLGAQQFVQVDGLPVDFGASVDNSPVRDYEDAPCAAIRERPVHVINHGDVTPGQRDLDRAGGGRVRRVRDLYAHLTRSGSRWSEWVTGPAGGLNHRPGRLRVQFTGLASVFAGNHARAGAC